MTPRFLNLLQRSGWEFWLPLPLVSVSLWLGGNWLTTHVLSQPTQPVLPLQASSLDEQQSKTILTINAEIDSAQGTTTVFIRTSDATRDTLGNATAKQHRYVINATQPHQIEAQLAQDMNMSIEVVKQLISYRIVE